MSRRSARQRTILVTGAASGIGLALVRRLWASEYRVVATARAGAAPGWEKESFAENERFMMRPMDVTVAADREAIVSEVAKRWGGVDILINNAGISFRSVIEHMSEEDELLQQRTNYLGPMALIRLALPHMRRQRWGRIVNVSSVGGMMAMPTMGSYSASKFALEGASEALWYELKPWNIKVVLVQPGFVHSNSFRGVYWTEKARACLEADDGYAAYYHTMGKFIEGLMNRAVATPDTIAAKIIRAIESGNPRLRIPATVDAYFFYLLRRIMPRRLYHWILWRNLPRIEKWGDPQ